MKIEAINRRKRANETARRNIGEWAVQVSSIEELYELSKQRRSVYCRNSWGLLPAIVVLNMQAIRILNEMKLGHIFKYRPPYKSITKERPTLKNSEDIQ